LKWDFYPYQGENRNLAEFPNISETPANKLPEDITSWFDDHFGFRNTFIRRYNRFMDKNFSIKRSGVVTGNDGWLFLDETVRDFMGYEKLSVARLKSISDSITAIEHMAKRLNVPVAIIVPPNKCNVYSEYLPVIGSSNTQRRIDQIFHILPEETAVNIFI
jgi:hypothetical protein